MGLYNSIAIDAKNQVHIAYYDLTNGNLKYATNCVKISRKANDLLDFEGDGQMDIAVYDAAEGWWFFLYSWDSRYGFESMGVGGGSRWKPVPGDYDGDGKTDVAVYNTVAGWWLFHYSSGGYFYDHIGQGGTGFTAVPGDYDGDGVTDLAVYQEATGYWFIKYSSGGYGFESLDGPAIHPVNLPYFFAN